MSLRLVNCYEVRILFHKSLLPSHSTHLSFALRSRPILKFAMAFRPNYQGGRRGGGGRGGGGRGRGGGGGGRGGEQRWWDPVWRAERLREKAAEMEVMEEKEWWGKMEQMKERGEQEMVIKRNFRREDQDILADMAYQLGLYL